jgi:prepilin-type N-terminal cleavage/methylation domain-containing protein
MKKFHFRFEDYGFTLVELLIAVSLMVTLSTIGFALYGKSQNLARDTRRKQDLKSLANALQVYHQYNNVYPATTDDSGSGTWSNFLNSNYINVMPVDPVNNGAHIYKYIGAANTYDICALLENNQEKVGGNVILGGAAPCGGTSSDIFYNISGP